MKEGTLRSGILAVSAAVLGFLFWLIYGHEGGASAVAEPAWLPLLNPLFNFLALCCLVGGYRAIRSGRRQQHIRFMLAAVLCSALFLVTYIVHHYSAGDTRFLGEGAVRTFYFFVLISHVLVTIVTLPMVLMTLAHAASGRFPEHKRFARRTLPLWLYVSVTGLLVFFLLRAYS